MLKLSVITDEVSQDFAKVVQFARRFELDGLELRSLWDTPVEELTYEQIQEIRKHLAGTELVVSAIASPFLKCDIDDPEAIDRHVKILGRCIEIAEHLGCDLVRTFTFWDKGALEDHFEQIAGVYERALFLATRTGVRLAVENEYTTMVGTGTELAWFLEKLDSPLARACWDPQNDYIRNRGEKNFREGYEAVKPYIAHVHLKDARATADGAAVDFEPLGDGEVGVEEQVQALVADGYRGFVSLETHWRPDVLLSGARDLDPDFEIVTQSEYASWVCMKRLRSFVEKYA